MSCFRRAGLRISQRAPLKMTPSIPPSAPSVSRLLRYWSSKRRAVERQQRLPPKLRGNERFALVGRLGELVRHLEEEQQGELLDVLEAGEPVVPQDAGVVPGPPADLRGVHAMLRP